MEYKLPICYIVKTMTEYAYNKKTSFEYEILDRFEAGIELLGLELPAIREKKVSLEGAYITIRGGEAYLVGATIVPIQPKNVPKGFENNRLRKLLFTKKEIRELEQKSEKQGLTIVPISVYNKGRKIKVEVAVVRGKKKFDKRESVKRREAEKDVLRTLKNQM